MNHKEKKNYNHFYLEMMTLIENHSDKVPPHEVGFSMILAATAMMLQCSGNPIAVLKLCNSAINAGIEEYEEDSNDHNIPTLWDKDES